MSVKFEKETIRQTGGVAGTSGAFRGGKHELADEIGTALTGGKGNVGQPGYLAVSLLCKDKYMMLTMFRHISNNSRRTRYELRC
jgi:hypothetical protein